LCGLHFCPLQK